MKTFYVGVREVHVSTVEVEAESAQEAIDKVSSGEGDEVTCEYSHTMDETTWSVEDENGLVTPGV